VTEFTRGLALIDRETGLKRFDDRGIDAQWHIGNRLHQLNGFGKNARLISERDAGVDVEHVRPGFNLRHGVGLDAAVVAVFHFFGENFSARRVDALANNDKGLVEADVDFTSGRADGGVVMSAA
jgi:hypothetical protein